MRALTWHGKGSMRCETVPDPKIEQAPCADDSAASPITYSEFHPLLKSGSAFRRTWGSGSNGTESSIQTGDRAEGRAQ